MPSPGFPLGKPTLAGGLTRTKIGPPGNKWTCSPSPSGYMGLLGIIRDALPRSRVGVYADHLVMHRPRGSNLSMTRLRVTAVI